MMDHDEPSSTVTRGSLNVLRIIVFALAAGVCAFQIVIAVVKGPEALVGPVKLDPLSLIALAVAVMNVPLSIILPMLIRSNIDRQGPPKSIAEAAGRVQTETIISCALLEGAAFFNLVVVFLNGGLVNTIAANVLLLLMMTRYPVSADAYEEKLRARLDPDRRTF